MNEAASILKEAVENVRATLSINIYYLDNFNDSLYRVVIKVGDQEIMHTFTRGCIIAMGKPEMAQYLFDIVRLALLDLSFN